MQFSAVLFTLAAAGAAVAAPNAPASVSCNSPKHPCNTYAKNPNCSDAYEKQLEACVDAGACGVRWFRDPTSVCCNGRNHPCQLYASKDKCTSEYTTLLQKCVASGCVQWVRDPLADCQVKDNDCSNKFHDCHMYTKEEQCSDPWKQKLQHCEAVGACGIRWFQDPMNVCKADTTTTTA